MNALKICESQLTASPTYNTHLESTKDRLKAREDESTDNCERVREIMSNIKKERKQTRKTGKAITHDSDNLHTRRC